MVKEANMDKKVLQKLEYPEIIRMLVNKCSTNYGKELAQEVKPITDLYEINHRLDETTEAKELLRLFPNFSLGGVHDIRPYIRRAKMNGVIEAAEFLQIYDTIKAAAQIIDFFKELELPLPILRTIVNGMHQFPVMEQKIRKTITQDGEVADQASPELSRIRRHLRSLQGKSREKLESMIRNPEITKYLQDPIISIRGDRFVLPVRQEYRSQVPGIIHDQSGSGATLFIEPMQVVEINNELQHYEIMERAEVTRILRELTGYVEKSAEFLSETALSLAELDLALAKGKLSANLDCGRPKVNEEGIIHLNQARHPLIPGKVVPITVYLGDAFDAMIVTGPNTGGKTVVLKTVGLLTLMAQSGLHIPAETGSEMTVFNSVFADIGDEQSIAQSLSTFSAHMTNIIEICRQADSRSLVLLDELGAGTDPAEGSALAMAIIDQLLKQGAKLIVTTHYSELKSFAAGQERVENASVEFDVDTLQPIYRLLMGIPGRSNAFEISLRLGLPENIVEQAKSFISQEKARTARFLADLETNQLLSEKERQEAEELRRQASQVLEWAKKKEEEAKDKANKIIAKAQEEALTIVMKARKESEAVLKEIREQQRLGLLQTGMQKVQKAREALKDAEEELQERIEKNQPVSEVKPEDISIGDQVFIRRLNQKAVVIEKPNSQGEVAVQAGIIKLSVKLTDIELLNEKKDAEEGTKTGVGTIVKEKAKTMNPELDLRGLLVDEAIEAAEKYIDDAYLAGLSQISIIHGKGTGALRKAITELVKDHPFVKSYRLGAYHEGGHGVTIVEIKK